MTAGDSGRKRTVAVFLILGYVCVVALLLNLVAHAGWIHIGVRALVGFGARWKWAAAAAVCFVCAWYIERLGRTAR